MINNKAIYISLASKKKYKKIMETSGKILALGHKLSKLISVGNFKYEQIKQNPFYKEHVSGSGFVGVPNQTPTSIGFNIRRVTNILELGATEIYECAYFWSNLAYEQYCKTLNIASMRCEHTIPNKILQENIVQLILNDKKITPAQIGTYIVENLIICIITKVEDSYDNQINLNYPFKKYQLDIIYENGSDLISCKFYHINKIKNIIKEKNKELLYLLSNITKRENEKYLELGKSYITNDAKLYHRVPNINNFINFDINVLLDKYYFHKKSNCKYNGKY